MPTHAALAADLGSPSCRLTAAVRRVGGETHAALAADLGNPSCRLTAAARRVGGSLLLLAGGLGSRMWGENKLYLKFAGAPLLSYLLPRLSPLFDETLLLAAKDGAREARQRLGPLLNEWNVRVTEDRAAGRGPLEGLCRGLATMSGEWGFLLGCDMPNVEEAVLRGMAALRAEDTDVVAAEIGGYLEPLHAFYSRRCLPRAEAALAGGGRIKGFYRESRLTIAGEETLSRFSKSYKNSFTNLNTPGDFSLLMRS
ncbi:MAG: molybdenum cofactor guanylyltransferase [bacterium]|nr:molybdenum cofactor guanylyltransferase [bacterium]